MDYKHNIAYRKEVLTKLLNHIENEDDTLRALYDDFKKPVFEAVLTETGFVISDYCESSITAFNAGHA